MELDAPASPIAMWQLSSPRLLAETPRAVLWRVDLPDGGEGVLKCPRPDAGTEEENAGAVLCHWQGEGAVSVLAERNAHLLLEYLPGPSAGDIARAGQDDVATNLLVSSAARLHAAAGEPPMGLHPLSDWCRALRSPPEASGVPPGLLDRTARLAEQLLLTAPSPRLLHGDLHHDNLLKGPRGWCAIDPKGLWGDPAFDLANCFRNPEGFGEGLHDPTRAVRMATCAEVALGYDRKRLLGWAAVQCGLSICWDSGQGKPQPEDLALLPMLLALAEE